MKKLFIYYSLSGNGDVVADYLKDKKHDIRKVIMKDKMPKSYILQILKGGFLAGINYKAKLINFDNNIDSYDEIIIGSPIWNGRLVPAINTVLDDINLDNIKNLPMSKEDAEDVARMIASHMGPWNRDKDGYELLPVPKESDEIFVHLCDYIASRNFLNIYFEDNEIVDSAKRVKKIEK